MTVMAILQLFDATMTLVAKYRLARKQWMDAHPNEAGELPDESPLFELLNTDSANLVKHADDVIAKYGGAVVDIDSGDGVEGQALFFKKKKKPQVPPAKPLPSVLVCAVTVRGSDGQVPDGIKARVWSDKGDAPIIAGRVDGPRVFFDVPVTFREEPGKVPYAWQAHLEVDVDGYHLFQVDGLLFGDPANIGPNCDWGEVHPVKIPQIVVRSGLVRAEGKALRDDNGYIRPFGGTLFWGPYGFRHERDRIMANIGWMKGRYDFSRQLCAVKWPDETIDPTWPDYEDIMGGIIDRSYELGVRTMPTLMGGADWDPMLIARRMANVINQGRQHKILLVEVANESFKNGPSVDELEKVAKFLGASIPNLVALSAPNGDNHDDIMAAIGRSRATATTVHIDRAPGDRKWRQVRQAWDLKELPGVVGSTEGPGPGSTVATNDDPLQLSFMRLLTHICGGAVFVLHNATGVTGRPNPALNRQANLWEYPNIEGIVQACRAIDAYIPDGVENWKKANTQWGNGLPQVPFEPNRHWEADDDAGGVNKAYAALGPGGQFIQAPIGVKQARMTAAHYAVHVDTVLWGETLTPIQENTDYAIGRDMMLAGAPDYRAAYIIKGRRL